MTAVARTAETRFLNRFTSPLDWLRFGVLFVISLGAIALFVQYMLLGFQWRQSPFLGVMVAHTMSVTAGDSTTEREWAGHVAGLQTGDHLTDIEYTASHSLDFPTYNDTLSKITTDAPLTIHFTRSVSGDDVTINNLEVCEPAIDGTAACTVSFTLENGIPTPDELGLQTDDTLQNIDYIETVPLISDTYLDTLKDVDTSQPVTIFFERDLNPNGTVEFAGVETCQTGIVIARCQVSYLLEGVPDRDFIAYFGIPLISGFVVLVTGLVVLALRPTESRAAVIITANTLMAICLLGLFDIGSTHQLIEMWLVASAFVSGAMLTVALTFPTPVRIANNQPLVQGIPIVLAAGFAVYLLSQFANETSGNFNSTVRLANMTVIASIAVLAATLFFYHRPRATNQITRDQANIVFAGVFLSLLPSFLWLFGLVLQAVTNQPPLPLRIETTTPFFITASLSVAFTVLQYRRFDSDIIISRGITYILLGAALMIGYTLLVLGASLFAVDEVTANDPLIIALTIFLISLLFIPVRTRLQNQIDAIYYRRRRNYRRELEEFSHNLAMQDNIDAILPAFREVVERMLEPSRLFIFMFDPQSNNYTTYDGGTDITFTSDSGVVELLSQKSGVYVLEPNKPWMPELRSDSARLNILRTRILADFGTSEANDILIGFVSLSPPKGSASYDFEAHRFIINLMSQVSATVKRAQVISSYEQRMNQLNVLSQVSQAVNFTIEPDDLLELIVTQTERLIQSPYFYIVLYDAEMEQLHFAFFLENDDRDEHKENVRWMVGNDLYSEVVMNSRPIKVDDYAREMTRRNYNFGLENRNTKAWMGVPLIAGSGTLGVMAVGESDPNKTYNNEMLSVFSDIGSLAATSLYQARLFTQANNRARQLGALNDVSRRLVEAEENIDRLLELITSAAVEILDVEAGSLLLVMEDGSGDLEFKASTGGSGKNLSGKRIKGDYGIVGEVATTGEAIIANDILQDKRFDGELDTDFITRSLLAVPLVAKEGVIGVLEVMNKTNRTGFTEEDEKLLTTFAGQAAIALENARLFEKTDQALQLRVQELEDLQQFSEELSRTLDVRGVAEITVRTAMNRINADAGLLAILNEEETEIRLISVQGYEPENFPEGVYQGEWWFLERGIIKRVLRTRQPDLAPDVSIDPDYLDGLKGALSQITVPMLSGDSISAILVLETASEPRFNLLDQATVMRLTEQASIAIANALLYEQITAANETKSEFVGFAAHELKTPLASIKGYADILNNTTMLQNMSEEQRTNALSVIRRNSERMQGIIDDMRDIAKSDAGKLEIAQEHVNIYNVIRETITPLENQINEKGQKVVIEVNENLPDVLGDYHKLIQVMTNFVTNANKYSEANTTMTIRAEITPRYINKHNQNVGAMMHISVQDEGKGLSENDLKKLFREDYFRAEGTKSEKGTGLGMIITKRIIEGHQGEVWVESTLGEGSTFHFVLPLAGTNTLETQTMQQVIEESASD